MKKTESILEQSKKQRGLGKILSSPIRLIFISLIIVLAPFLYGYFSSETKEVKEVVQKKTVTVIRKDLRITRESDGKIMNPNIVDLAFFVNGTIERIMVKEGQKVEKGAIIAELDTRDFDLDLKMAQANVEIAYANLNSKKADLTDTELKIAESDLSISQSNFDIVFNSALQKVDQSLDYAIVVIETTIPEIESALQKIDEVLVIENNTNYNSVSSTFHDSIKENRAENQYKSIKSELNSFQKNYKNSSSNNHFSITKNLNNLKTITKNTNQLLNTLIELLNSATPNSNVPITKIESTRADIYNTNSKITKEISALTQAKQNIDDALLNQKSSLVSAENAIDKTKTKVETSKNTYEKLEINKSASISVLQAQLRQSQIQVEKAKYNLSLTTLSSPIDGEIIIVNGEEGETIKADNTSSDNAFIKILSDENFTVESYVEELDIVKLRTGQKVYITLDALEDVSLDGVIDFISNISTSDNNGIVTYLVRISITDIKDVVLREGMTAYANFVVSEAEKVLAIPVSAVKTIQGKPSVQKEDLSWQPVTTGFTDGNFVEVISGLKLKDKILTE